MTEFNPDRISLALSCLGWTQKELAMRAEIAPARITNLKTGRHPFTEQIAERISFITGFPITFYMMSGEQFPVDQLTFRKQAGMRKIPLNQVVGEFTLLSESVTTLAGMASGITDWNWIDMISPRSTPRLTDVERIAQDVRTCWNVSEHGPIRNMTRSLERGGIITAPLMTPVHDAKGDGITRPGATGAEPIIAYLPGEKTGDRLRFTLAHELGHLILHRHRIPTTRQLAEQEANIFAGALLFPREDALASIRPDTTLDEYAYMKGGWGISIAALIMRSANLGIISAERKRSLNIQRSNRGWRIHEPVHVPVEQPILLKQMVAAAFGDSTDYTHPVVGKESLEGFLGIPFEMMNSWCVNTLTAKVGNDLL
ncbi:ImmA/IrrE family metallo-endopeptidase [Bifidobacterium pseudolongum]|uniref:DNA-binding protein n=1 Tax=Bifidobacterium pseudolongum subsp. globosum TaxID=1690 RepID=A0A2N3QVS1_9BIFI|nr:ImmA/IrrE family metallo-endopeptidase [Bifidobacterium pseudolongum]PKU96174.1 DNA-binding protein [Bifidobacterium pseudolongum subsp. globosum]